MLSNPFFSLISWDDWNSLKGIGITGGKGGGSNFKDGAKSEAGGLSGAVFPFSLISRDDWNSLKGAGNEVGEDEGRGRERFVGVGRGSGGTVFSVLTSTALPPAKFSWPPLGHV